MPHIILRRNPVRSALLLSELLHIWTQSVLATHHFLQPEDIRRLRPAVRHGLRHIPELIVAESDGTTVGFMGVADDKIEMLFLSPAVFRQGVGRQLVTEATGAYAVRHVDVNEQNGDARLFYERMGFSVFERTAQDAQGNPFPILRMKRAAQGQNNPIPGLLAGGAV